MVLDPHLAKHLAHWGIDVMKMEKVRNQHILASPVFYHTLAVEAEVYKVMHLKNDKQPSGLLASSPNLGFHIQVFI